LIKCKSICIIPARGGSKRIPKKNIKFFHGKPLIAYSIETALASGLFEKVVVSTDDEVIASVAREYGAEVPFMRSSELSDDFATSGDVIEDAIKKLQEMGEEFSYVCTIYATAPLLEKEYLIKGFEALKNSDARMAFSVTSMPFPIQRTFKITQDGRCKMFTPEHFQTRSQDLEDAYQDAGQFYWQKIGVEAKDIPFGSESIPIVLPRHLVQDIDTPEDWKRVELLYETLYKDRFDEWNQLKKRLHNKKKIIKFSNGNVYFMAIGKNIGDEVYGKDGLFLRPVLVYKKLSKTTFLGIPLTSQKREGSYYFAFNYKKDKISIAMLHQMRVFDIRRSEYYSGYIKLKDFAQLKERVIEFMKVTPNH
jgi:pseudaminic acid cytidylyltransferase